MSNSYRHLLPWLLLVVVLSVSTLARGADASEKLTQALIKQLRNPAFDPQRTAVFVAKPGDPQPIVSIQPDLLMNPASCVKIVTAAAALSTLGPDYRFTTKFQTDAPPEQGTIKNLYIRGDGDPFFVTQEIWRMLGRLRQVGIKQISGDLVIDESFFDAYTYPRQTDESKRAYAAATSAVAVNFNSISIMIAPGTKQGEAALVTIDPPNDYIQLKNEVKTGSKLNVKIDQSVGEDSEIVLVSGSIPLKTTAKAFYRNVFEPTLYAGSVIHSLLLQHGITVSGKIRGGKTPEGAHFLFQEPSKPLGLIIRDMNKFSNNFVAEQLLKHMGAVRKGEPGTTSKGVEVLQEYLALIGIPKGSYTVENGSGFSNVTRLSARQLVKVLTSAYEDFSIRPDLLASFSILGVDGTMKQWSHPSFLRGRVRAKTGTLGGVSSLAGYIPARDGEVEAFAILANGFRKGIIDARDAQIQLLVTILEQR